MDQNIMSVCEEQKRLEMESELLDGGSDAEDTADVALHLMDISDDGECCSPLNLQARTMDPGPNSINEYH